MSFDDSDDPDHVCRVPAHQVYELVKSAPDFDCLEELGGVPRARVAVCGRTLNIPINPWLREALLAKPEEDKVMEFDLWFQKMLVGNCSGFNLL